ncbi:helix-turn-helix transcriptional regulator [Halomonas campaniensis]|uniref:helix-turn-helix transcriptional regulator n=1 Tax=Halomonas campaniensis TaxID=213554 RepID=UPI0016083165|nr:AlpA family phage regulatory protein [Halomonas campaniensis]
MTHETYLTVQQVADRYATSTSSIWRWVRRGQFPRPVKLSPGCTRWRASDVEAWEESREVAAHA